MLLGKTIVVTGIASGIGARIGELAVALGADVIGVDVNAPAAPLGAFVKADIALARGDRRARRRRCRSASTRLCNVAGVSGMLGAPKTLAINFYGLRALTEALAPRLREGGAVVNVASIAGYGWRANLERAKALGRRARLSRHRGAAQGARVQDGEGYPLSKELLLLWTMQRRASAAVQGARHPRQRGQPGAGGDADPKEFRAVFGDARVDDDIARVGRAGTAADIAPAVAVPLLGRRALDQRRQPAGRRRAGSLDQRRGARVLTAPDRGAHERAILTGGDAHEG